MNVSARQDCEMTIRRIQELLGCGIFEPKYANNPLQQSAFIELMICLRDLLHKAERYAQRINFTDDVLQNEYVSDVTDGVTALRDACCHINSVKRTFDDQGGRGSYIVVYGKGGLMKLGDLELRSDYEDDTAYFYGKNRLYMNRHIIRAFQEACCILGPVLHR